MTFKKVLILAMLATAGVSASATSSNWGALGPVDVDANVFTTVGGAPIDDFYSFTLGTGYEVLSIANYFVSTNLNGANTNDLTGATLTLWKGTYGDATADTQVASFNLTTTPTNHTFADLTGGAYYFEVSGTAGTEGSHYYLDVEANQVTPPSNVPEPANVALLLSGVGILGLMAKRRKSN